MCGNAVSTANTIFERMNKAKCLRATGWEAGRRADKGVCGKFQALALLWTQSLPGSSLHLEYGNQNRPPFWVSLVCKDDRKWKCSALLISSSIVGLFLPMVFSHAFSQFFCLTFQNTWGNNSQKEYLFWLIASEESTHGHLALLLLQPWQERNVWKEGHSEGKCLTSQRPGSKKRGTRRSQGHKSKCPQPPASNQVPLLYFLSMSIQILNLSME